MNVATVPRFDFRVRWASRTDVGRVRANNEDVVRIEPELSLFLLADGMGGHAAGEVAAALATDAVVAAVSSRPAQRALDSYLKRPTLAHRAAVFDALRGAAAAANAAVRGAAAEAADARGMGCTLDAALLVRDRLFVLHVGDGRVYLARAQATLQLTHDHSFFDERLAAGAFLRPSDLRGQNPLTNAIGLSDSQPVDCLHVELAKGDRVLMCSDGVHGAIPTEGELSELVRAGTPEHAARALIDAALLRGGRDNASVVIVDVAARFASRSGADDGVGARDLATARASALLVDLPMGSVLRALAAAVEVELGAGALVPRVVASDQVAWIVLSGTVDAGERRVLGPGALLYAESLVGEVPRTPLARAASAVRALRLRGDDFREVCAADVVLAAALFERLARYLARRG